MSYLESIGFFGAFLTGIVIGLFGGGGSILAVPVYKTHTLRICKDP